VAAMADGLAYGACRAEAPKARRRVVPEHLQIVKECFDNSIPRNRSFFDHTPTVSK
jgi:hypothetical protein